MLTVPVAEAPQILGELTIADNELRFTPRFSLTPSQTSLSPRSHRRSLIANGMSSA